MKTADLCRKHGIPPCRDNAALKELLGKNGDARCQARGCRSCAFGVRVERAAGVQDHRLCAHDSAVCRTQTNRTKYGQTVLGCGSDDHIAMCHVKAVRHDVPLPSVHLPPGTSKWNKIEHRLFSFITQNGPHRDQSQNPLGACMLSRTGGLAKGAGWLPTPTERCKLFFPCARALLLCSRPR
jgi:Rhodopirellula transposase DDE domain